MKNEGLAGYQSETRFSLNGNVVGNVETLSFQVHPSPLLECSDGSSRYRPAVRLFLRQCHPTPAEENLSLQTFANRSVRVSALFFAILFGIACIYAVKIQPSIHSKWASHGITLACLVGLFVIASGILTTMTEKTRPAVPFLLGLFLFVVGISGIALIAFPDIVPFSVTLWEAASSSTSQTLVLVGAAFVTPVVLAYSALAYWIFRGKTPEQGWEA